MQRVSVKLLIFTVVRTNLLFDLKIACWISEPEFNDKNYEYGELVHFFLNKLEGLQAKFDYKSQFVRDLQTSRELYKYLVTHLREKKLDEAFWKEMKLSVILSRKKRYFNSTSKVKLTNRNRNGVRGNRF
jgi:hypothetical protein